MVRSHYRVAPLLILGAALAGSCGEERGTDSPFGTGADDGGENGSGEDGGDSRGDDGESGDQAGRRLDFIGQELLREANTIASKANDFEIGTRVVNMKCHIDRIKEQTLNVE